MDFSFSEEEIEEVLTIFQQESEEQIENLNANFLKLEANPQDKKVIQEIFRDAHSLKGSARMIGLDDIQTIAHKLEDIFGLAKEEKLVIQPEVIDIMCSAVDSIAAIIEESVKNKGEHNVDVQAVVMQLQMIETGQMGGGAAPAAPTSEVEPAAEAAPAVLAPEPVVAPVANTLAAELFSDEEMIEVLEIFQQESEELIQRLNDNFLKLEINPQDAKVIQEMFRDAHSLKGSARMIGLDDVQSIAHKLEDIFGLAKEEKLKIQPEIVDVMCSSIDAIDTIIKETLVNKGAHTINVQAVVTQLQLIETGQIGAAPAAPTSEVEPAAEAAPPVDKPEEKPKSAGMGMKKKRKKPVSESKKPVIDVDPDAPLESIADGLAKKPPGLQPEKKPDPGPVQKKAEKKHSVEVNEPTEDVEVIYDITEEGFSSEEIVELKRIFYAESAQSIDYLFKALEILRQSPYDREALSEAYRHAHSIEGSARIIGFDDLKDITHSIRDIFEQSVKEEIFINKAILDSLEGYLIMVQETVQKDKTSSGISEDLDLDALQEQIDKKMESYKKVDEKPKKTKKDRVSISTDSLDFDEEEVLKDFGVGDTKPSEPKRPSIDVEDARKKLAENPLSLTDEELGDLDLASLEAVKPVVNPDQVQEKEQEETSIQSPMGAAWSVGSKKGSDLNMEEKGLEELLGSLSDDMNLLSHNVNNKSILQKAKDTISIILDKCVQEENKVLLAIINKLEKIFVEACEGKINFTKEMALVMFQSVDSSKSLTNKSISASSELVEDPSLIYQRLMILHQTAKLTAGIPFEEEEEPDVFKTKDEMDDKFEEEPQKLEEKPEDKSGDHTDTATAVKAEPVDPESKTPATPFSQPSFAPVMPAASKPAKFGAPKKSMAPIGQMSGKDKKTDAAETYTIKTLRVDTRKLDQLVAQVGELIIAKIKAKERLTEIEQLINQLEEWQRDWAKTKYAVKNIDKKPLKAAFMPEGTSIYTPGKDIHGVIRENSDKLALLTNDLNMLYRNIQEDDTRLTLIIGELEDKIKNVRLLPLATIFNMYPRMVRDLARQQNKEIELDIRGSETTVDKKIIEEIKSPLMHLIRNAVDHGIEEPDKRESNDKPRAGRIVLSAYHLENSVMIEIIDDGRGINIDAIKKKVIDKELLTGAELDNMTENQIMNIIFWPGFSTSSSVTDISGRGVGMDVVHTKITQLNGKVKVHSELGKGSKVSIQLPVTMATIQVFLVSINGQTYAIPASAIKTAVLVKTQEIFYKEGKQTVLVGGVPVFLKQLSDLLELPKRAAIIEDKAKKKEKLTVLVIQTDETNIGFIVDGLLGDQEILHKNLEPPLIRVRNVAGVTTLGSGEVCLILNVGDLIKTSQMNQGASFKSTFTKKLDVESQKKEILVVDDSVTTRILERNILRAAGYNVTVAVNGLDALTKLATQHIDLVVSDVEMPDITGYELTTRVKNDEMLCHIPVVLVTSLASEVDRQKGYNAGASAYITKGGFNQEELLGTVKKLLTSNQN